MLEVSPKFQVNFGASNPPDTGNVFVANPNPETERSFKCGRLFASVMQGVWGVAEFSGASRDFPGNCMYDFENVPCGSPNRDVWAGHRDRAVFAGPGTRQHEGTEEGTDGF